MKLWHKTAIGVGITAVVATVGISTIIKPVQPQPVVTTRISAAEIYPHPETIGFTNPDVTQANISQNICNPSWSTKSIRPPSNYTAALKVKQLANGYALNEDTNTADYEEDHLISLELGGNPTDERNLWPEPYTTSISDGGAKIKDTVENYLHKQVCNGSITLAQAQTEISTDWYRVLKMQMGK